jgi:hypothetical protein
MFYLDGDVIYPPLALSTLNLFAMISNSLSITKFTKIFSLTGINLENRCKVPQMVRIHSIELIIILLTPQPSILVEQVTCNRYLLNQIRDPRPMI